ncbi:MAG TPA: (Fe-S)-binding protein [Thermodesulfobacteriota bacterium]|nr:(Fe-S)-binding protein [Thermodesulfobacteriota bacterium]
MRQQNQSKKKVSLFITCLVDNFFPQVGESMVKVLRKLGVEVDFPVDQTCCGQPAFNSGFQHDAKALAKRFLSIFQDDNCYVVCPSGSCTTMVKIFYRELLKEESRGLELADRLASRTYEFSAFLTNVLHVEDVGASYSGKVTYHDSCHLLRELRIRDEPRKLIKSVKGIDFVEMNLHDACCGFGGTFSIMFPGVSISMLEEKIISIVESGADTIVSTDMGCLMHIEGAMSRRKIPVKVMHIAELLASEL